jgi:hypothetical protein
LENFSSWLERPNSVTIDEAASDRLTALIRAVSTASDEARPVSSGTFQIGREFLEAVPPTARNPEVSIHPDGDVEFEWFLRADRVLTISLSSTGETHYAALIDGRPISGRDVFAGTIPAGVADVLAQVAIPTP